MESLTAAWITLVNMGGKAPGSGATVSLSDVAKLPHVSRPFREVIRKRKVQGKVEPRLRRVMESQLCSQLA